MSQQCSLTCILVCLVGGMQVIMMAFFCSLYVIINFVYRSVYIFMHTSSKVLYYILARLSILQLRLSARGARCS